MLGLARVGGRRNAELAANRPNKSRADLSVSREGRDLGVWTSPLCVLGTAYLSAAVRSEVALKVAALHAAAVNRRCSRSASAVSPASSSSGVSTVLSASRTFSRASSRVRP